jgi:hypothetical protein
MPGQIAAPVRLGRARQGLFSPGLPELAGLEAERIVQVPAHLLWLYYPDSRSSTAPSICLLVADTAMCAQLRHVKSQEHHLLRFHTHAQCLVPPAALCLFSSLAPARNPALLSPACSLPPPPWRLQLAAGRFMSAAVTAAGEVWTFGGGFNGELGSGGGGTWSPAPRRVGGALAQVCPACWLPR